MRCEILGCKCIVSYGYLDEMPRWCKKHAPENAINIKIKKCSVTKCKNISTHGSPALFPERPTKCEAHARHLTKLPIKACIKCVKIASWGLLNQDPEWCGVHAPKGTVEFYAKCKECEREAIYGRDKKEFCILHTRKSHKNFELGSLDHIKFNGKCHKTNCESPPTHGYTFKVCCETHRELNMMDLSHECGKCERPAIFGFPGDNARYCEVHSISGMLKLDLITCAKCGRLSPSKVFCKVHSTSSVFQNKVLVSKQNRHSIFKKSAIAKIIADFFNEHDERHLDQKL